MIACVCFFFVFIVVMCKEKHISDSLFGLPLCDRTSPALHPLLVTSLPFAIHPSRPALLPCPIRARLAHGGKRVHAVRARLPRQHVNEACNAGPRIGISRYTLTVRQ